MRTISICGMSELWAPINEADSYEVSSLGRVRHGARVLNPAPRKADGYVLVTLSLGARRSRINRLVHVLVAGAFLPNPENLPVINHINCRRGDNRLENLEWTTVQQNRNRWTPGASPGKRQRRILQMTLSGTHLQIWDSARAAERAVTGAWNSNISKCCRGKLPSTAGFRWAYLDDIEGPLPGEEWRTAVSDQKHWEVSSLGRVRTHTGYTTYGAKGGPYLTINGKCVHVLIAEAFCFKPEGAQVVNHRDGDKQNNVSSNLEWCTQAENTRHAVETGLIPKSNKLKKAVIQNLPDGTSVRYDSIVEAGQSVGISSSYIGLVCRGKARSAAGCTWEYAERIVDAAQIPTPPQLPTLARICDDDPFWEIIGLGAVHIADDDPLWAEIGL